MRVFLRLICLSLLTSIVFSALPAQADETSDQGLELGAVLTSDLIGNVSGGARRGGLMLHNLDLTAAWHGQNGWEAFAYVLQDFKGGFSDKYVGDTQTVSNIDTSPGLRLFEAYIQRTRSDGGLSASFGLINLNCHFDVQDVGGLFLNSSHGIGPDFSQAGPSIFPISSLGALVEWRGNNHLSLRAGIFDAVPGDVNDDTRFAYIRLGKDEGAQMIVEGVYTTDTWVAKLGHWTNTLAVPTLDGQATQRPSGTYGQLQLTLYSESIDPDQGLKAWLRTGAAPKQTLAIDRYTGGGLVYTGLFPGRDADSLGFAMASAHFGGPYQASVASDLARETSYEVAYQAAIRPGLMLKPDVQYIRHPGGRQDVKDAVVVGLRVAFDLLSH